MANALAFIGGGLLEGIGKGIVATGRQKREEVLEKLEHERDLERDENRFANQRGLLTQRLASDERLASEREAGADIRPA